MFVMFPPVRSLRDGLTAFTRSSQGLRSLPEPLHVPSMPTASPAERRNHYPWHTIPELPAFSNLHIQGRDSASIFGALWQRDFVSNDGEAFFSLTGEKNLGQLVRRLLESVSGASD